MSAAAAAEHSHGGKKSRGQAQRKPPGQTHRFRCADNNSIGPLPPPRDVVPFRANDRIAVLFMQLPVHATLLRDAPRSLPLANVCLGDPRHLVQLAMEAVSSTSETAPSLLAFSLANICRGGPEPRVLCLVGSEECHSVITPDAPPSIPTGP